MNPIAPPFTSLFSIILKKITKSNKKLKSIIKINNIIMVIIKNKRKEKVILNPNNFNININNNNNKNTNLLY